MPLLNIKYFFGLIGAFFLFTLNINATPFFADLDGGKISGAQMVTPSTTPQILGNEISPSGGVGAYTYQWESSVEEINWTLISGAVGSTFQPGALSRTTYFRRKVISGTSYCYSNTVQILVNKTVALNIPATVSVTPTAPLAAMPAYAGVVPDNLKSVTTYTLLKPVNNWTTKPADILPKDYMQVTTYVDGIYRPIQNIIFKGSKSSNDLVDVTTYDQFGREIIKHLPYIAPTDANNAGKFRLDATSQQPLFYKNLTANQEAYFYSSKVVDSSVIGRISQDNTPGKGFAGSKIGSRKEIRTNFSYDNVRIWDIGDDAAAVPVSNGMYEKGMLAVTVSTNEEGAKVYEFIDREGKTIMTSILSQGADKVGEGARTYYVYDKIGNLRYILSPLAVKYCTVNSTWNFAVSQTAGNVLKALCYKYLYDEKGRVISSEMPGRQGTSSMVYDTRDRLVFVQDAAMKANGKGEWVVYFYDGLNRKVMTAIYKNISATRESLQTQMNQASATGQQVINNPLIYDLTLPARDPAKSLYSAGNSITLLPGFDSGTDELTIEIQPNGGTSETMTVSNPLPGISSYEPLTIFYYDNYNWQGSRSFSTAFQLNAGNNTDPQSVVAVSDIIGSITGQKTKVLGRNQWLTNTIFYDKFGRPIQLQSENITGGLDMTTVQYDFSGKVLSAHFINRNPQAADKPEIQTQLRYEYDNEGNPAQVYHTIWDGATAVSKLITENQYDALGRLTQKKLGNLETLSYEYTYLGQLKGINTAYAKDKNEPNFFGMELSYDNGFANNRLDGKLAGITWRRKGNPDEWHSYGYTYDNSGSLTKADYTQNASSSWSNGTVDYTVNSLDYDENGNIKKMKQNGMLLGNVKSTIDDLTYTYDNGSWSNQLVAVADGAGNQQQGDFKNLVNLTKEYEFDVNGNLTKDMNSGVSISYNQLINKPEKISLTNEPAKNISFIYDASGNKLQKIINDGSTTVTYTYINGFVYKNDKLLIFPHPEGRIRKNANGALVYDYFISDHLGNVRTVLTEETNQLFYKASHEDNPQPVPAIPERDAFTFPKNVDVIPVTNKFYDYNGSTNRKFVRLNNTDPDRKTGTAKVLKVMSGDKIEVGVQSYYATNSPSNNTPSDLPDQIVAQLINALLGPVSVIPNGKGNIVQSTTNGLILNKEDFTSFITDAQGSNTSSQVPKAYLNYVLFDDNFKMVDGRTIRVSTPDVITPLAGQMDIKKNGYLYVYISNESPTDVYFDDLVIKHTTGPLLQEDSYYPFGLQMRGLSSMALNRLQNDYLYNGIEKISEFDLEIYDAFYRNLDPQIGKWWQIDPKMESAVGFSPYNVNFNDPINLSDPKGDCPFCDVAIDTYLSFVQAFGNPLPLTNVAANAVVNTGANELSQQFVTASFNAIGNAVLARQMREANALKKLANDINKVYPGGIPQPTIDATIRQFQPGFADKWAESDNFIAQSTYEVSDGVWVTAQSLNPFMDVSRISHLTGVGTIGDERVKGFVDVTSTVVENYVGGQAIKAIAPIIGGAMGGASRAVSNTSGWVKRSVFKSLDAAIQKKVAAAIENGIVAPTGKQGIIKLTATEAAETGYQFKVKILGKGGDIRIYGNALENGHIFFDKIMGH